jgi:hypothetical protein
LPSVIAKTTGLIFTGLINKYLSLAREALMQSKKRYLRDQKRKIIRTQTYRINEVKTPYYEILIDGQIKKIHGKKLKTYFSGRSS